jgi:TonB family protein
MTVHWDSSPLFAPPVEIQPIDPAQLDQIRTEWKKKSLLLDKNSALKAQEEKAPDDARYFSDRNRRVEKEQRAAQMDTIPRSQMMKKSFSSQNASHHKMSQSLPTLGDLGLRYHLESQPLQQSTQSEANVPGSDQWIKESQLPVGNENLLNTQESIYYSFYARLYESIGPLWQSRVRQIAANLPKKAMVGEYVTAVDIVLDEFGNLKDVRILQSSGVHELDQIVDQSWRKIQRFPNPPKGLLDAQREVHTGWSFRVYLQEGAGFQFLPPARQY